MKQPTDESPRLGSELVSITAARKQILSHPIIEPGVTDLIGFRYARMLYHDGRPYFRSMVKRTVFDTISEAKCIKGKKEDKHHTPDSDCSCGYYATTIPVELPLRIDVRNCPEYTLVVLQVQFSGLVVPGSRGYRAERQDIMTAWVYHTCFACERLADSVIATDLAGNYAILSDDLAMVPACRRHAILMSIHPPYSLADLTNVFGTEFAWMERPAIKAP